MKISRDRLKQIIKEELETLALAEITTSESNANLKAAIKKAQEELKKPDNTPGRTAMLNRQIKTYQKSISDQAQAETDRLDKKIQGIKNVKDADKTFQMFQQKSKDRDYAAKVGKLAGLEGDTVDAQLANARKQDAAPAVADAPESQVASKPSTARKTGRSSSGGRKAWKSANRAMKAAAKAAGKTWQTIGPNEKTELGKQAWKAKLAARKAYKSMKSGRGVPSRAVAKKTLRPLGVSPKLKTRPPGLPDSRSPEAKQRMADGTPLFDPKDPELAAQAGSEAKPTGLASVGVKKPDTAVAKAPTKKATRKRTLAQMNQTELDGVRRELAAGNIPDNDDAKRIYDNQVRKNIANLRKTNPNLSVNGRRIKAQIRAKKQIIKAANTIIAAKNKRERDGARTNMTTGVDLE